ncbi:hypothetical protein BROUX41_004252 [Berkeleyomyces rouxiae]
MPRPTRTRRMRGAPTAEVPHPTRTSPAPAAPEEKTSASPGTSSRLRSISSDIYSATPPPSTAPKTGSGPREKEKIELASASTDSTARRSTRGSLGGSRLQLEVQIKQDMRGKSTRIETKSTPQQPSSVRRSRASRRDTSGLDINDEVFDDLGSDLSDLDADLDLDLNDTDIGPEQATVSANTSTISVSQFKRRGRSRKPSFANSVSGPIRPSSRGTGNSSTIASTFNIGLFRRRAREPSILGANRRRRANSVATDNSDIGTDIGTDVEHAKDDAISDGDDDLEGMDDFQPDAISTPLNKRRSTGHQSLDLVASASKSTIPRKRKTSEAHTEIGQAEKIARIEVEPKVESQAKPDEAAEKEAEAALPIEESGVAEVEVPASAPSSGISPEVEVPASIPPPTIAESSAPVPSIEQSFAPVAPMDIDIPDESLSDASSDEESLPSPLSVRRVTNVRPSTPTPNSADLAPPMSSSSEVGSPVAWPSIRDVGRRRRHAAPTTPIRARNGAGQRGPDDENSSPLSSPPSLTHSPNYGPVRHAKAKSRQAPKVPPPKVLTAELQTLLPQRRTRTQHAEVHELEPGADDDEDELVRPMRRKSASRPTSRGNAAPSAASAPVTTLAQRKRMQFEPSRRISRTYGTPKAQTSAPEAAADAPSGVVAAAESPADASPEEEAERSTFIPLPDDTFTQDSGTSSGSMSNGKSTELKQAVRKFKEVDKWEMEFEEVTEPESPPNAR